MLGKVHGETFPAWIRAITLAKQEQSMEQVREDCLTAARENRQTGVALIGEHSDRPFSREAMEAHGIQGPIFQELITFNEKDGGDARWEAVQAKARLQGASVSPHAPYTVDRRSLERVSQGTELLSVHASESESERELFVAGTGEFAAMYERLGVALPRISCSPISLLDQVGFLKPGRQLVHCCTADDADLDLMAERGVTVAHCPRSNQALGCPPAPVEQMLQRQITVGIGMDSCASSGPIDMFAEMRAVQESAELRKGRLEAKIVWRMATTYGADALGYSDWDIAVGSTVPLIAIDLPDASSTQDLINQGAPEKVRWISPTE